VRGEWPGELSKGAGGDLDPKCARGPTPESGPPDENADCDCGEYIFPQANLLLVPT